MPTKTAVKPRKPTRLVDVREPINILYYGEGGTGKTTSLATMANMGPVLLVNAESGVKRQPLVARGVNIENIELYPEPGAPITFEGLQSEWVRIAAALEEDPDAYAGVVWDSITEIYKRLLDSIVDRAVQKAERQGRERDPFFIDRSDYGVMTEQVRSLVRKYRDLPCHFGVSALSRRDQDDDGSVAYQPAITPALQNDLVGWVDQVVYTSVVGGEDEDEFRGLFRPLGKFRGKDRFGTMPKILIDPTFERVHDYVRGDLTVDSDPVMVQARERAEAKQTGSGGTRERKTKE